jgi:hypothetical protein
MTLRGLEICRLCAEPLDDVILSLGNQPLSNALASSGIGNEDAMFPLDLRICPQCSLGQIGEFVSPEGIFHNYTYFSSTSLSWLKHAKDYAEMIFSRLALTPNDLVIEIASNDGYLLQFFKALGSKVLGIEPAENVAKHAISLGIPTQIEFFGTGIADKLLEFNFVPKLVICNNVLAHVPDINDFMSGLAKLIRAGAVVSIEAPSLKVMLEKNLFDTIYHEHFSYLSVTAVDYLARKHGVSLQHVEFLPTHGGSYRFWIQLMDVQPETSVQFYLDEEQAFGISTQVAQVRFADASTRAIANFRTWCIEQQQLPIGFGAAAKATVLLNAAGVSKQYFECIADNANAKQNRFVPGVRVPIFSPDQVLSFSNRNLVIFPWNISEEITSEISAKYPSFVGEIWTVLPEMRRLR